MRGYIPKKELREVMHESGRVPALIRAINNAIPKGGQKVRISFWSETGNGDEPPILWETEDES